MIKHEKWNPNILPMVPDEFDKHGLHPDVVQCQFITSANMTILIINKLLATRVKPGD